jgi:hypothetical protein
MKKMLLVLITFILCIALSGCIDIFQYITKDGKGVHRNTIKITVSKTVFAMASGLSGSSESVDYEKLFDERNDIDVAKEYSQFNATVKPRSFS